ncbi:unnamed protein product [Diamesa serratosioi]
MESDPRFVEVNEIKDISSYLQSIDWQDPWIYGVIGFHVAVSFTAYFSRKIMNLQIVLFCGLLSMVYFSEYLNEVAAMNWNKFSKQQYFDSQGLFISIFFSMPILLNCIFILGSWLTTSVKLMTQLKTAQLKTQLKRKDKQQQPIDSTCHQKSD